MEAIGARADLGVRVVGFVGPDSYLTRGVTRYEEDDLEDIVAEQGIRRIVVTMGDRRGKMQVEKLLKLKTRASAIQDGPEYYESITGKIPLESLRLSWLLFSPGFHVRAALRLYKRLFSIILSGIGHPYHLADHAAGGHRRFAWTRKGPRSSARSALASNGKLFTVFKFRSMFEGSHKLGADAGRARRPRVTRVGKWLRRTRIDELPQLFNIIKGDMAFVGPRPFVPEQEEECAAHIRSTANAGW